MSRYSRTRQPEALQPKLDATRTKFQEQMPADVRKTFIGANRQVLAAGIEQRAVKQGQPAPDFTLPNVHGKQVQLSSLLQQGPVVLAFYRGGW
jgi:hypothetical protein